MSRAAPFPQPGVSPRWRGEFPRAAREHPATGALSKAALVACLVLAPTVAGRAQPSCRFQISYPSQVDAGPITGRVFVIITRENRLDPRIQILSEAAPPFFGKDVSALRPGEPATIDDRTPGYPLEGLRQLPAGDYYVEAFLNRYTELHRADGHTIWAHLDWVGGLPSLAPGSLRSEVSRLRLDPSQGFDIRIELSRVISLDEFTTSPLLASLAPPKETEWIRVVKFRSRILSKFWGHPMYLGATVLLPKGYPAHPKTLYPVVYNQGHFYQAIPWDFNPDPKSETPAAAAAGKDAGFGTGYEFYQAWNSERFPRFLLVTFQHPCPYFDDSYAVNSANCGPFGDAILQELIPYVEKRFRALGAAYARLLEGGSTGGWESLALQMFHPKFFGGAWVFDPDPVDFRRFQLVNLYQDQNAFTYRSPGAPWLAQARPWSRTVEGQVRSTVEEVSRYEEVLGSHGRSDYQLDGWWSIFCPVGADGYPEPLWSMRTGQIDQRAVAYARDRGYDLSAYLQSHWTEIGPDLARKLHFFVGDMDSYYLNLAVYELEDALKGATKPQYAGTFTYGRPKKGHGWHPMTWAELLREMAAEVRRNAPPGANPPQWNY